MSDTKLEMVTKAKLKERGWTDALIRRFVPAPDATRPNPHYRSAAPMCLYKLDHVKTVELTQEFQEALVVAEKHRASGKKVAEQKRNQTQEWVASLPPPELPERTKDDLVALAVRHYNRLWESRSRYEKSASTNDSEWFLQRITVNYVRHQLTEYEARLDQTFRRVGGAEAAAHIRAAIFDAIAKAYPWLANECARQQQERARWLEWAEHYRKEAPSSYCWRRRTAA